jgi:hypothetical protein
MVATWLSDFVAKSPAKTKKLPNPPIPFRIGKILRVQVNIFNRPEKIGVCVNLKNGGGHLFLINSENREMFDCIPFGVKPGRYFPTAESFLSCKNSHDCTGKPVLVDYGYIHKTECDEIIAKVMTSRFLTKIQIQEITDALNAAKPLFP